ncbi:MAG: AAA family ATPase, partial [Zestosphaera sp.]
MSGIEFSSRRRGVTEDYVKYLEMRIQELETEVEFLRNEVNYYKKEIEKLLSTPLIEGVLLEVLPDGKAVVKSSTGPNLVVDVMGGVDVRNARPGSRVMLNQRGSAVVGLLPSLEDPYVRAMEVIERPSVRYSDVGGLKEQIRELREVVELPLKKPELFREMGIEPPKGILLYGPPGCGKTLLAKAVAGESNATFVSLVASELAQKFVGEGARIVREVFGFAR